MKGTIESTRSLWWDALVQQVRFEKPTAMNNEMGKDEVNEIS